MCRRMSRSSFAQLIGQMRHAILIKQADCAGGAFCCAIMLSPQRKTRVDGGGRRQPGFHGTQERARGNGRRNRIPSEYRCGR